MNIKQPLEGDLIKNIKTQTDGKIDLYCENWQDLPQSSGYSWGSGPKQNKNRSEHKLLKVGN